jgi:hypothetical protein
MWVGVKGVVVFEEKKKKKILQFWVQFQKSDANEFEMGVLGGVAEISKNIVGLGQVVWGWSGGSKKKKFLNFFFFFFWAQNRFQHVFISGFTNFR